MSEAKTLNRALERAAERKDCGLRILDRRERATWLGWPELHRRARQVAGGLRARRVEEGQTVGLFYPTGRELFEAFFGTLLAGAVPVPLYPPVRLGRLAEYQERTAAMLQAAGVRLALTHSGLRRILGEALAKARCRCLSLGQLPEAASWSAAVEEESLALVQFSSGTTAEPKPVALTQRAVMVQSEILNGFWPDRPDLRHAGVSWLPLYHDMGLIGCVFPALERPGVLTLIPTEVFVARPAIWLRTISRYRATISPAPNFAYALCVEKVRDEELEGVDLSSWRVALNGAETVVPSVQRAFSERFAGWGFRAEALTPVYGLSEAALAVTFSDVEGPAVSRRFSRTALAVEGRAALDPQGLELASVGQPLPGFEVEVRDESGKALAMNRVGRIWVRGPTLMQGYLHRPAATAAALRRGWLDTGDLGFLHEEQLYITGRAKDLLIVRGRNHAPEEIENALAGLPGVRSGCCAAVSHLPEEADHEQVWLFVESRHAGNARQREELAKRCRRRVLAQTGVALDRVEVLKPRSLPRTSSGKIRRREALRQFLGGELEPPAPVTAAHLLEALGRSSRAQRQSSEEP